MRVFGRGKDELSAIFNHTLQVLVQQWLPLLRGRSVLLSMERIKLYADAINAYVGFPCHVFGFIDTQFMPCAKPIVNADAIYNGYEKANGWKYQDLDHPDDMSSINYGPIEGRGGDSRVLGESALLAFLDSILPLPAPPTEEEPEVPQFTIYGDKAYPLRPRLMTPFRGNNLTPLQQHFNTTFASIRITVEWGFGKTVTLFNFRVQQKSYLSRLGHMYIVATLLRNCHTCFYQGEASWRFKCPPPSIYEYLRIT